MSGFLSPIRLQGPTIDGCTIKVSPNRPSGDLICNVEINSSLPSEVEHVDGLHRLPFKLNIIVTACMKDDETRDSPVLDVQLELSGDVSVPDSLGIAEDSLLSSLQVNAVSLCYSSARSYLEMLTSLTKMGRFSLPPIDPRAYIKSESE